jgi:alpha-beta hydrolase superfamily lysophospholipase
MTVRIAAACLAAIALAGGAVAQPRDEPVRSIPTRGGVTEAFVLVRPSGPPVASVILFMGGKGALGLGRGALGSRNTNFLVRNRHRFAERGLLVAVVDAPSDRPDALVGFRTGAEHATDVAALIAALRAEAAVPVWLVGTSMGSVSAASVAARLRDGGPDGIVLTSSVMATPRDMGESLQDVALDKIRVPVLVVHHRDDACRASRYADTSWAMRRLSAAPKRELLTFSGGDTPQSDPCEPLSAHGYFGIDAKVVEAIAAWIAAAPAGAKP